MARAKNEYGLKINQENFIKEYIKCGISYQAYLSAYPAAKKWTRNAVDVQANRMLNNPKVIQRLREYNEQQKNALCESITLNKRKVLEEIIKTYNETLQNGQAERASSVKLLELMSKISKLIGDNTVINNNVNIQNNQTVNEVSGFLDL